ncbi:MAG: hypothetical protein IJJ33_08595 [Victivallales bacterium]|nr:hypothetical protein [Victivallales bacterium]
MNSRLLPILLLALICGLLTSCVSVGEYESNDLPWSKPAAWENTTLGVPVN